MKKLLKVERTMAMSVTMPHVSLFATVAVLPFRHSEQIQHQKSQPSITSVSQLDDFQFFVHKMRVGTKTISDIGSNSKFHEYLRH